MRPIPSPSGGVAGAVRLTSVAAAGAVVPVPNRKRDPMTDHHDRGRPTRNQRREAAREKARAMREQQRKRDRRRRILAQAVVAVAVLAVLAVIGGVFLTSNRAEAAGPRNMQAGGVVLTKGMDARRASASSPSATPVPTADRSGSTVDIVTYVDYLCPYCRQFEETNNAQIQKLVDSGAATLEVHPVAILTSNSAGTKYSLRAANAAACVADKAPDDFWKFHQLLYANQPEEGTAGLTDAQLKSYAESSGAPSGSTGTCIDDGSFEDYIQAQTQTALDGHLAGTTLHTFNSTPLVLVNGKKFDGSITSASQFRSFILQAQGETFSTSTPTPSPTGSATPGATTPPAEESTPSSSPTPTSTPTATTG